MSHSLFIADLHLSPSSPKLFQKFQNFLEGPAREATALYILGDLFEIWVGDDDIPSPFNQKVVNALAALTQQGTQLFYLHGNRDFLLGNKFAKACGATHLTDPTILILEDGVRTLLTHGDQLCTEDEAYQAWRKQVRSVTWQRKVMTLPIEERYKIAQEATTMSTQAKKKKTLAIMDVTLQAVIELLRKNDYPRLIHGNTHRPARHTYRLDDNTCERWVLTDWNSRKGGYVRCDENGCQAIPF